MSRNRILLLTLLADIVGAVVIVGLLPIGFTASLVVLAVYGTAVYAASRGYLSRQDG